MRAIGASQRQLHSAARARLFCEIQNARRLCRTRSFSACHPIGGCFVFNLGSSRPSVTVAVRAWSRQSTDSLSRAMSRPLQQHPRKIIMSPINNNVVRFVLAAATVGLMLAATDARARPHGGDRPTCDSSCQSNKAVPPTKLQSGKPTGPTDTAGRSARPQ
jgi:hypothetical protein